MPCILCQGQNTATLSLSGPSCADRPGRLPQYHDASTGTLQPPGRKQEILGRVFVFALQRLASRRPSQPLPGDGRARRHRKGAQVMCVCVCVCVCVAFAWLVRLVLFSFGNQLERKEPRTVSLSRNFCLVALGGEFFLVLGHLVLATLRLVLLHLGEGARETARTHARASTQFIQKNALPHPALATR